MRIYLQHVDSFIGRALLKELKRNGPIYNRVFGSLKDPKHSQKPAMVRRLVQSTDKRFVETVLSCKLIVLHLREDNNDELEFILQTLKTAAATLEEPLTLIVVSSIFVWGTGHDVKEADYHDRQPLTPTMKAWKDYEERVLAFNHDEAAQVKAHVVGCGALFGGGECSHFEGVFKDAWLGNTVALPSVLRRTHCVPTVNVFDVGRMLNKLVFQTEVAKGEMPYLICCDTSRNTLTELWQAIVNEMTEAYTIKDEPSEEHEDPNIVGASDLTCIPTELMCTDDFAWNAPGGLTVAANARFAGAEYAKGSNQQAIKVLLFRETPKTGDPSDKAAELERKAHEAACVRYVSFLKEEFGITEIKSFGEMDSTNTTRYRGYVLEVQGELTLETCKKEFLEEIEVEEVVQKEAPAEGEEGEESPGGQETEVVVTKKLVPKASAPEHVIALAWPSDAEEDSSFVTFFRENFPEEKSILYLPPKHVPEEVEKQMESVRIYMDGTNKRPDGTVGRALNANMKPEKQVIEETLIKHEEAAAETEGMAQDVDDDNLDDLRKKEPTKAEKLRSERLDALLVKEKQLQSSTIADYVNENVVPTLTEGLIKLCKLKPEQPIEYLADFLEKTADDLAAS
ncbi:unnamed protein product [Amoebophrya sp. A120]|nr:unnamed protein product [Amoebophrya sp. A120]|eukprot:GSA120T00004809001.1